MSLIRKKFESQEFYPRLEKRALGFSICMDHLSQFKSPVILETGSLRAPDNWEGDGQSTLIWNWVKEQKPETEIYSVDISPQVCDTARKLAPLVTVVCSDSILFLNRVIGVDIISKISLLYLDSFNWSPERQIDSAFHHFAELASVWRLLPKDCLIVVDDRHSDHAGKHVMIKAFMDMIGIQPRYEGYQIAWLKP